MVSVDGHLQLLRLATGDALPVPGGEHVETDAEDENIAPEVNGPEAIVAANLTEHLVVPPQNSKEGVVEENLS